MGFVFASLWLDLAIFVVTTAIAIAMYFSWAFKYWERKGIYYIKPSVPFGTMSNPLSADWKSFPEQILDQYAETKAAGHKHAGLFTIAKPIWMPVAVDYVRNIMTKDFDHFVDRGFYYNEKDDPLSAHLFSIEGAKWRNMRVKLTPTFTSGKMKMMFGTLVQCGRQLEELVRETMAKKEPTNIKDVLARFTTDIIGSCAFGLDCNSCKEPDSDFRKYGKMVFTPSPMEIIRGLIGFSFPKLGNRLRLRLHPKACTEFFMKIIVDTVRYREAHNIQRKDFMQLLVDLKNEKDGITLEELAAQAFVFFIAGYETSSTTMTFALLEMVLNPEVQTKAREEIEEVLQKHDGELGYDAIGEMKYMGQVVDETLRKYPPLPALNRKCIKDYIIPGTDQKIEEGTLVMIPNIGIHRDAEYFPDPEKFDPDRFSDENKSKIAPFTYFPFGEGPRNCIGLRFGLMQTKVGLAVLLKNFTFSLNERTKIPITFDPKSFIMSALGDIWLDVDTISS